MRAARRVCAIGLALAPLSCGQVVRTWPDGTQRAEGRIDRIAGAEEGLWTYWYPTGSLREQGRFDAGRRAGVWIQWFPNGRRRTQGERRWNAPTGASEREGAWTFWHENGVVHARGTFRAGAREGHWDYGLDDGGLDGLRTGEYHDDRKID